MVLPIPPVINSFRVNDRLMPRYLDAVQIKRPISSEPTIISIHLEKKRELLQPVISP